MNLTLPFLDIVLFLAAVQGVFLSALILQKYGSLFANRFLSAYMFLYSVIFINLILGDLGIYGKMPFLLFSHIGVPFLIGPLHYLYVKNLIRQYKKFDINWSFHLIPFCMIELIFFIQYQIDKSKIIPLANSSNQDVSIMYVAFNWAIIFQTLTYMIITLILLSGYAKKIKNLVSSTEKYQLNWLRNLTLILTFVIASFLLENTLSIFKIKLSHYFSMTSYLAGFAIYLVGYLGLLKSEVLSGSEIQKTLHLLEAEGNQLIPQETEKYIKSGLTQKKAEDYLNELLNIIQKEKLYLDPNLTLNQLADKIKISTHNLSEVINTRLDKNFFDFINHYRVEEVKKELLNPAKNNQTILSVAYDAGFNSKASFNTIFKKFTGMTPSEYRKNTTPIN